MKIAYFTDSFLPIIGGTEIAVSKLASCFSKKYDVLVACPKNKKVVDDYPYKVVRCSSLKITSSDYLGFPKMDKNFKKTIDKFKPDIIHIQSVSSMCQYGLDYAKKHNIPTIMTIHTKFKQAFSQAIKSKVIVNSMIKNIVKKLNRASRVYTVCKNMKDDLFDYGYKKECGVIRNGNTFGEDSFDQKIVEQIRQKYNITENDNILLCVARLMKYKNQNFIIKALDILNKQGVSFKMFFVGKGEYKSHLKKMAKKFNLEDKIIFTGAIKDNKIFQGMYATSDLFLFPSKFDNDPLVIVEAALAKTPSLVLENTGSSERIINNQNGFIVKENIEVYANKIKELLANKEFLKKCGENASNTMLKTWEQTAKEYEDIYKELAYKE